MNYPLDALRSLGKGFKQTTGFELIQNLVVMLLLLSVSTHYSGPPIVVNCAVNAVAGQVVFAAFPDDPSGAG
jgi:hypothetical protein